MLPAPASASSLDGRDAHHTVHDPVHVPPIAGSTSPSPPPPPPPPASSPAAPAAAGGSLSLVPDAPAVRLLPKEIADEIKLAAADLERFQRSGTRLQTSTHQVTIAFLQQMCALHDVRCALNLSPSFDPALGGLGAASLAGKESLFDRAIRHYVGADQLHTMLKKYTKCASLFNAYDADNGVRVDPWREFWCRWYEAATAASVYRTFCPSHFTQAIVVKHMRRLVSDSIALDLPRRFDSFAEWLRTTAMGTVADEKKALRAQEAAAVAAAARCRADEEAARQAQANQQRAEAELQQLRVEIVRLGAELNARAPAVEAERNAAAAALDAQIETIKQQDPKADPQVIETENKARADLEKLEQAQQAAAQQLQQVIADQEQAVEDAPESGPEILRAEEHLQQAKHEAEEEAKALLVQHRQSAEELTAETAKLIAAKTAEGEARVAAALEAATQRQRAALEAARSAQLGDRSDAADALARQRLERSRLQSRMTELVDKTVCRIPYDSEAGSGLVPFQPAVQQQLQARGFAIVCGVPGYDAKPSYLQPIRVLVPRMARVHTMQLAAVALGPTDIVSDEAQPLSDSRPPRLASEMFGLAASGQTSLVYLKHLEYSADAAYKRALRPAPRSLVLPAHVPLDQAAWTSLCHCVRDMVAKAREPLPAVAAAGEEPHFGASYRGTRMMPDRTDFLVWRDCTWLPDGLVQGPSTAEYQVARDGSFVSALVVQMTDWKTGATALASVPPASLRERDAIPFDVAVCGATKELEWMRGTCPQDSRVRDHPMNLNAIRYHPGSLLSLVPDQSVPGFDTAFGYVKLGDAHFCAHVEQLQAQFVHHVVEGRIRWFMVHPEHVPALLEALAIWLREGTAMAQLACREDKSAADMDSTNWADLVQLLLHSKRLFPRPDDLRAAGFNQPILEFDLSAGECLVAHGGFVHWGVNQCERTVSLATNAMPESWLTHGPRFVVERLTWAKNLRDRQPLEHLGEVFRIEPDVAAAIANEAVNLVPASFVCPLVRALEKDLSRHLANDASQPAAEFAYTLDRRTLEEARAYLRQALELLSELSDFFKARGLNACMCSNCSGRGGKASARRRSSSKGVVDGAEKVAAGEEDEEKKGEESEVVGMEIDNGDNGVKKHISNGAVAPASSLARGKKRTLAESKAARAKASGDVKEDEEDDGVEDENEDEGEGEKDTSPQPKSQRKSRPRECKSTIKKQRTNTKQAFAGSNGSSSAAAAAAAAAAAPSPSVVNGEDQSMD